jgi:hypothetical protein
MDSQKDQTLNKKTMAEKELKQKLKTLEKQIAEAEEAGEEEEYKYLTEIKKQTIHMYSGSVLIWQSGTPPPPPPYGGG